MQDLQNIFNIIEEHYTKGNSSEEILKFIELFPTNINNLEICKNILTIPESPQSCKIFASDSIRKIISNFVNYIEYPNQLKPVINWIIVFLTSDNKNLPDVIYKDLSAAASLFFVHFFESDLDKVNNLIGRFVVMFEKDPLMLIHGLQIHAEIIDTFNTRGAEKETTFKSFRLNTLLGFFNTAKNTLLKLNDEAINSLPPEIIQQIIQLACLNLTKTISFKTKDEENANHIDKAIKEQLSDPALPIFICQLFKNFQEPAALDVISSYFQVSTTSFNSIKNFYIVINEIFLHLSDIIQNQTGFNNPLTVFRLSLILYNISNRISFNMANSLPNMPLLIESVAQFSIMAFQNIINQPNVIDNIISFWQSLEKIYTAQTNLPIGQLLASKSFDIYSAYFGLLLNEVSQPNNEVINLQLLKDKISPFVSPIRSFVNLNQNQIYMHLISAYKSKKEQFQQCLENNVQLADSISSQIALFIQIFIEFLQKIPFTGKQNQPSDIICIESFSEIISLMQITIPYLSGNIHLFPEIEFSFSIFINIFRSTFYGKADQVRLEVQEAFYHRIHPSLGIFNPQSCNDFFFRRIITALQGYYGSDDEELLTINLLTKMAQKVLPSEGIMHEFLQSNLDASFNFLKNLHYRSLFSMAIMSIIGQLDNSLLYNLYINNIISKFPGLPNQESILILSADIMGMFKANLKSEYYHARFNSIFPEKMKVFADSLSTPYGQNMQVLGIALKMCKSIVFWTPAKRIEFDHISPNGVILFTFSAQIICSFISFTAANLQNPEFFKIFEESGYCELRRVLKILSYLLSGRYVPFDAFIIYNDNVFVNVLNGMIQLLSALNIDRIRSYSKTFSSLIKFFKDLCINQLKVLCTKISPEFLNRYMVVIFESVTRGLFELDQISTDSIQTIQTILQFIIDERGTPHAQALMGALTAELMGKANAGLWQLLFNGQPNNFVSEPIRLFVMLNRSAFDVVKAKITQIAQQSQAPEIAVVLKKFEERLPAALEGDGTEMRIILKELKNIVNQKIVIVSFS